MTTHVLALTDADLVYDVHGPLPPADGRPLLFMIGQPMDASGFAALVQLFPERTVITYDPRGLGRSIRKDGRVENTPEIQASDLHHLIDALAAGPVEMFASSGGAVTALALVAAYPGDLVTLVAHEPPLIDVLPDAGPARRAADGFRETYQANGWGAGMAAFIAMTSWQGEFTDAYFAQPAPDPAAFGLPVDDDGSRDDPLLSDRSLAILYYRPDLGALAAAPSRVVIAVGEESMRTFTGRTAVATAELLGQQATVSPAITGDSAAVSSDTSGNPRRLRARSARFSTYPTSVRKRARAPFRRPSMRRLGKCATSVVGAEVLAVHRRPRLLTPRFGDRPGVDGLEAELVDEPVDQFPARSVLPGDRQRNAVRRATRRAPLQQVLPPDPVEHLVHRGADLVGHPRTFGLAVLDGRDLAVALLGVVVVGLDHRGARLARVDDPVGKVGHVLLRDADDDEVGVGCGVLGPHRRRTRLAGKL